MESSSLQSIVILHHCKKGIIRIAVILYSFEGVNTQFWELHQMHCDSSIAADLAFGQLMSLLERAFDSYFDTSLGQESNFVHLLLGQSVLNMFSFV